MAAADSFKPQGQELTVVKGVNPVGAELGKHVRAQGQPQPLQPAPRTVQQGGERFMAETAPVQMGATQTPPAPAPVAAPPVPSSPQARGQFQPAPPVPISPQQMGARQPVAPVPVAPAAPPAPVALAGVETFSVYIDGTGPDGSPLTTDPIPVQFPAGSILSGMRYERAHG